MTTENTATDSTETLVKTRKPRSKNKPKTVDKQALLASRHVDRFNAKRDDALVKAAERVNARFDSAIAEFVASLPEEVQKLVTGVKNVVDPDAVEPEVEETVEEEVAAE